MPYPQLYRKRLIPAECVQLKDDTILRFDDDIIVTTWNTLHPKKDLHHGASCYYRNEGWKISRFCKEDDSLMYIYCDIVSYSTDEDSDSLIITDLLADVIIYPDGFVRVVDLDELAQAVKEGLMTGEQLNECLVSLNSLLTKIYAGKLEFLTAPMDNILKDID